MLARRPHYWHCRLPLQANAAKGMGCGHFVGQAAGGRSRYSTLAAGALTPAASADAAALPPCALRARSPRHRLRPANRPPRRERRR
jgi:hypothetical protein